MAKFHLDRLKEKYGFTGGSYKALMQEIIANNTQAISRAMGRKLASSFKEAGKKFQKRDARLFPQVDDVLPKRSVFTRKAAIDGVKITDTLKTRLDKNLRDTMKEFQEEGRLFIRRGPTATALNPEVVRQFEAKIQKTFEGYVKRNPEYNLPGNVHTIAVTETRAAVNEIKGSYTREFIKRNPDLVVEKVWRHNRRLSRKPRIGHMRANGQRVPFEDSFRIENEDGQGFVLMQYPHDPAAPAEHVVGCHCDFFVQIRKAS